MKIYLSFILFTIASSQGGTKCGFSQRQQSVLGQQPNVLWGHMHGNKMFHIHGNRPGQENRDGLFHIHRNGMIHMNGKEVGHVHGNGMVHMPGNRSGQVINPKMLRQFLRN